MLAMTSLYHSVTTSCLQYLPLYVKLGELAQIFHLFQPELFSLEEVVVGIEDTGNVFGIVPIEDGINVFSTVD